jgi:hypothetical protein
MIATKLESELLKIKKDLHGVRKVNDNFCHVLEELNTIKEKSLADPQVREQVTTEFKEKEIIDIFAGIEKDFRDLRVQLSKQEVYKERVADFVESLRTKKTFSFEETTSTILFLEGAFEELNAQMISIRPEFLGSMDLLEVAITYGFAKSGSSIIVPVEMIAETLSMLISKRMFKNIIFELDNTKLTLKSSNIVVIESNNHTIRKLMHI